MFKFIRKKLLQGMINDFINDMPKYRMSARLLMLEKKDELIEKIENVVFSTIKKYFKSYLGDTEE